MNYKKYRKQFKREWRSVSIQLKRINYVSAALSLVLTGATVASACGVGGGFV